MSTVLPEPREHGVVMKAGALAAGTVLAGTAFLGGTPAVPLFAPGLAHVQRDVAMVAVPTFEESLQSLLNLLGVGTIGDVLALLGNDNEESPVGPLTVASPLSALLADLNPHGTTLDAATGGLLGESMSAILGNTFIGGDAVGSLSIDQLVSDLLGADVATATVQNLADKLGLGDFTGLLVPLGLNGSSTLQAALSALLSPLGVDPTKTLDDIPTSGGGTLGAEHLNELLGITNAQLNAPWDEFVDSIATSGILAPTTTTLGSETLGDLLGDLLPHDSAIAPVTDDTTTTAFLDALGLFQGL